MQQLTPAVFEKQLNQHLAKSPTAGQNRLFYAFTRFIFSEKERVALLMRGYAGTGKTSCISAMVKTLETFGISVQLLAPTGRAARVLTNYSGRQAWTIHRHIYMRRMDKSGGGWFELKGNELKNTIFIVDEASMIGTEDKSDFTKGDLLDDLITHVYSGDGCRLVLVGDNAQLPPVGSPKSPALDLDYLRNNFSLQVAEIELDEVIRQKEGSGILENATSVRKLITQGKSELPHLQTGGFTDIVRIESDLQDYIEDAYRQYGKDEMIIITRSNKRANLFNQQMRARILWHEEEINAGDRMMVLKNNYYWINEPNHAAGFIANGDVLQIQRVLRFEDREEFRFCKAIVSMVDYPELPEFETILLCNSIWEESASVSYEKIKTLGNLIAQDYPEISDMRALRKKVMADPYFNALQVKFAYAVTCHKAQGGQWPCVFVDQGYLTDEMAGIELNRWFYTAITRAQEKLFLVGFEDKLFESK